MAKKLIITEKNTSAKKISEILSNGNYKTNKKGSYTVYTWDGGKDLYRAFGIKGHILKADFPEGYSNWQKVDLRELVKADIEKKPIAKALVNMVRSEAKDADELIIATDFDREGELIGIDALNVALKANKELIFARARYSALTPGEIKKAFSNLDKPYFSLAEAGEARQDIDLIWGATLTRFISLASKRLGKFYLSVGRVQSPTLCLIVKREQEIKSFISTPYYQIKVDLETNGITFTAWHKKDRFFDKKDAEAILKKLGETGIVTLTKKEVKDITPPTPFSTTDFLSALASQGIAPARGMSIAESLYTSGFISYPRTDNTVYPKSLDLKEILQELTFHRQVGEYAAELMKKKSLKATRGKRKTTDHPPIYPTGIIPSELSVEEEKVYELVVRRFLATLSDPATYESQKAEIEISRELFFIRGFHMLNKGFLKIYPYKSHKEEEIPDLKEGDEVRVLKAELLKKETQPPSRYSQARLIKLMEELGLGTKATRHSIIQNLYERGYIIGDPPVPTALGVAVAETIMSYMTKIAEPDMTAELEKDMTDIAEGKKEKASVVNISRLLLLGVLDEIEGKKEHFREKIKDGIRNDLAVGRCVQCNGEIVVRRARVSKKRFLGCSNYPDCKASFPLPQKGAVYSEGRECDTCGVPMVKVINKGRKPWVICPNPNCHSKEGDKEIAGKK